MGLTATQLVGHHAMCDNLAELGKLSTSYTTHTGLHHAFCADVEILRANGERHGVSGTATSADDAIVDLYNSLIGLSPGDAILVRGSRNDKRTLRWDHDIMEWVDAKK